MTAKEINEVIEYLRKEGNSDEDIAASFYLMFSEGKINLKQFEALLSSLGYELDEEFMDMSDEEQRIFALTNKYNYEEIIKKSEKDDFYDCETV